MFIKKPSKDHKSFRLLERVSGRTITIAHPELEAINHELKNGLAMHRAYGLVQALRDRLETERAPKPSWLPENMELVDRYWKEVASHRNQRRPEEARRRLEWAVRNLGSTPLITSSTNTLRQALAHLEPKQRSRCIDVLNALFAHFRLDKHLIRPKVDYVAPTYLTLEEVGACAAGLSSHAALCVWAALATGCRYGELFALTRHSLVGEGHVNVTGQRDEHWKPGPTKNGKTGKVYIVRELRPQLRAWLDVPEEVKIKMRAAQAPAEGFGAIALRAIGRHEPFKNLRHSYAKIMLERGATLTDLMFWMRDRAATVEQYYANWELTTAGMQSDLRRFG